MEYINSEALQKRGYEQAYETVQSIKKSGASQHSLLSCDSRSQLKEKSTVI